ncbi:hypothetical protein [Streptomyces sp. S.PB5]|uniref:hypothetical protein n=1 Tax=Streptomyces sp. S.PB5 TaxID=3020844 RepID=UPI0025AF830B|nr:hypothetical protein [Streptomyces sp. S.PB5]MDN3028848.1 hypothetical protein [Streptomyces sp. S.PB5]
MTNRRWIAAAVVTAGVVVGAALYIDELETGHADVDVVASGSHSPPAEDWCIGTRPAPPDADPEEPPLERTLVRLDKLTAGEHSAVFTGMSVDEDANAADVWRIPDDLFDAAVCDAAEKGVKLRLHPADVDRKTLDALADRISEDMYRWDGTFQLREVGVDERGFVRVGVDDPKKAEPLVEKEFGSRYIRVERVGQAHADVG